MTSTLPNSPYGFVPVRHQNGGVIRAASYTIASAYASTIFAGDLVSLAAAAGRNIVVATTSLFIRGVFMGCQYVDSNGNVRFEKAWIASTAILAGTVVSALVYDDPLIVFKAMVSGVGATGFAAGNVNEYYDFLGQSSGSLLTGKSAEYANFANRTKTANKNVALFLYNLTGNPGNDPIGYGGYTEAEFLICQSDLMAVWSQTQV